jgi:hypothetical protein
MGLLAARSMLHNARTSLPHLIACTVVVALHYDIQFLNMCQAIERLPGSSALSGLLSVVVLALDLFSALLILYTNNFLLKHRLRELGLYSVLGMERRHMRSLLRWETAYTALVSIGGGLITVKSTDDGVHTNAGDVLENGTTGIGSIEIKHLCLQHICRVVIHFSSQEDDAVHHQTRKHVHLGHVQLALLQDIGVQILRLRFHHIVEHQTIES